MPKVPVDWFDTIETPWLKAGDATELLHAMHPRIIFLKTLPRNAAVLDMGAGDGSLHLFRDWLPPRRRDLKLYAYAMEKGSAFDRCDGFELGRWPEQLPDFGGRLFGAIFTSHFIEHIDDPLDFLRWAIDRLAPGGRLYCEWPSEHAMDQHPVRNFRAQGIDLQITHYRDDHTHQKAIPARGDVIGVLEANGLLIDQRGLVTNPYIESEILAHARGPKKTNKMDGFALQSAFWSQSRWAQYVVATRL